MAAAPEAIETPKDDLSKLHRLQSLYLDIEGYRFGQTEEDKKVGGDLAKRIGKTQADVGVEELKKLDTLLSEDNLKKMANGDEGGAKDLKRPDPTNAEGTQAIEDFKNNIAPNLVNLAREAVDEVKTKVGAEVEKFRTGTPPTDETWKAAFEEEKQKAFVKQVDDKIQSLKEKKQEVEDRPAPPALPVVKRDLNAIYDAQIASLEKLKTEFKAEMNKQKSQTLLNAISKAKHPPNPEDIKAGGLRSPGSLTEQDQIERKVLEKHNEPTAEDYARVARVQRRKMRFAKLAWTKGEEIELEEMKKPENRAKQYVLWGKKSGAFTFSDDGIHFKIDGWLTRGANVKRNINDLLNVFYAETGSAKAVLTIDENISYNYVMKMAEIVQERQAHGDDTRAEIDKRPTVTLSPEAVKLLIAKVQKDDGLKEEDAREKVRVLNAMLSGEGPQPDGSYTTPLPTGEKKQAKEEKREAKDQKNAKDAKTAVSASGRRLGN